MCGSAAREGLPADRPLPFSCHSSVALMAFSFQIGPPDRFGLPHNSKCGMGRRSLRCRSSGEEVVGEASFAPCDRRLFGEDRQWLSSCQRWALGPRPGSEFGPGSSSCRRIEGDPPIIRSPRTDRSSRPRSMCGDGREYGGRFWGRGLVICGPRLPQADFYEVGVTRAAAISCAPPCGSRLGCASHLTMRLWRGRRRRHHREPYFWADARSREPSS